MKELAPHNRLLFVNSPYTFKDVADGLLGKKKVAFWRALGLKNRLKIIQLDNGGTVHILTPPIAVSVNFLPEGWLYQVLLKLNGWLLRQSAVKALKRLGMTDRLINIVAFNQAMGVTTGRRFNEHVLIYHCYDEIRGAQKWARKHGVALENRLLKMVDGVIVTSQGLYNSKSDLCKACFMVKNAVNFNLFSRGFYSQINTEKTVGYIGSIDERLDYDLLQYVLTQMPDVKFVFVGRINTESGNTVLHQFPNASFTGAKKPDELPGYLKTFSAGIIPFVKSDFTRGIYPMKINEYLAVGLPVISTDFSDLSDFEDTIRIAGDKVTFLQCLQTELATDTAEKRAARRDIARQNTWAVRAEELSDAIEQIEAALVR
jgi:glycosyltransferase involved in cell wall biosynthesis